MAAKKVKIVLKLNLPAGKANPAPPIGPALGQHGVNIMDFCNKYNEATKDKMGQMIPAEVTIYEDRTFEFITKLPPRSRAHPHEAKDQKRLRRNSQRDSRHPYQRSRQSYRHRKNGRPQHHQNRISHEYRHGHRPLHGRQNRITSLINYHLLYYPLSRKSSSHNLLSLRNELVSSEKHLS